MGAEVLLLGDRIMIRCFTLEDAYSMRSWGEHKNFLFEDYNFPYFKEEDIKAWFVSKTFGWTKKYFSVYNEERKFIGYVGIKQIKRFRRESTLGIVFDPNYINRGYGSETLKLFLKYYFEDLNMNTLYLAVAQFNKRAIKCYQKCGFKRIDKYLDLFYNQSIDLKGLDIKEAINSFVIKEGKIYNYIYKMKIDKKMYLKARKARKARK